MEVGSIHTLRQFDSLNGCFYTTSKQLATLGRFGQYLPAPNYRTSLFSLEEQIEFLSLQRLSDLIRDLRYLRSFRRLAEVPIA